MKRKKSEKKDEASAVLQEATDAIADVSAKKNTLAAQKTALDREVTNKLVRDDLVIHIMYYV